MPPGMTPLMRQYHRIKARYPDAILFFRMGDFYEMFHEDAAVASRALQIALTKRGKSEGMDIPLCGVPYHAADTYIARLVKQGHKVAICEQVEDPRKAKGLVKREVVRVVTPGTVLDPGMLEEGENHFLAAWVARDHTAGLSFLDLGTGKFLVSEESGRPLETALADRFAALEPREMVVPASARDSDLVAALVRARPGMAVQYLEDHAFDPEAAYRKLTDHLGTASLQGFGCEDLRLGVAAAGALLGYVEATQKGSLPHIRGIQTLHAGERMYLDAATIRNLELVRNSLDQGKRGSLLSVVDRTRTAMGARRLRSELLAPLLRAPEIRRRHEAVAELVENPMVLDDLREALDGVYDMERLMGRVTLSAAGPRDLVALAASAERLPRVRDLMARLSAALLAELRAAVDPLEDLLSLVREALHHDPPPTLREGRVIRDGYSAELDELRSLGREGREWIARMEARERDRTGIASLKVKYNKVFGYYIEVTKANLKDVPPDYVRKQTLVNAERFITPELKEYESKVLHAQERMLELEGRLFQEVREAVAARADRVQATAAALAEIDMLASLAETARVQGYVRPRITEEVRLRIRDGRHPVLETLDLGEPFVPNDTEMDGEARRMILLTGPNMAGKSTYMRQVALIVLLAQVGSFVPAAEAEVGLADRIFTRVGASDALTRGQSTFLVEMNETAEILHHATPRSLILLDEIGRGTSTFDGISIAWAVAEEIHDRIKSRTLFATHYHELTELARTLQGAVNCNVAVREWNDRVIFLHKIVEGGADKSYGIQVARLAGLPASVIARAREVLDELEKSGLRRGGQLDLFADRPAAPAEPRPHPLVRELAALDPERLTPLEALNLLAELQRKLGSDSNSGPASGEIGVRLEFNSQHLQE